MRNPVDLACLFADINNRDSSRFAELDLEDAVNQNSNVEPRLADLTAPMQHGAVQ